MLDALNFLSKLETQLVALMVRQPAGHLREYHLVIAVGACVPRRRIPCGFGSCQDRIQFFTDFLRIDLSRVGTRVFKPKP